MNVSYLLFKMSAYHYFLSNNLYSYSNNKQHHSHNRATVSIKPFCSWFWRI